MKSFYSYILLILLLLIGISCKEKNPDPKETATVLPKPSASELKTVAINGDSLHYLDMGQGKPVVFVHGGLGDYRTWAGQIDTFALNHRVIAYSRRYAYPNKQQINDTADYTVIPHAEDLVKLITTLNLGPVHLVGHSWGAFTALKATLDHPGLIRSVVLAEPPVQSLLSYTEAGDSLRNVFINRALKPSARAFKEGNDQLGVSLFIGGVMGDSLLFSKVPEQVRKKWLQNTVELRGHVINESFIDISPQDIKALNVPVLVMKGEVSPMYFRNIADELNRLLPNSRLFELPEASHGMQGNNRQGFNAAVLEFIGSQ